MVLLLWFLIISNSAIVIRFDPTAFRSTLPKLIWLLRISSDLPARRLCCTACVVSCRVVSCHVMLCYVIELFWCDICLFYSMYWPLPNVFACATSMPTSQQNVCVLLSLLWLVVLDMAKALLERHTLRLQTCGSANVWQRCLRGMVECKV